MRVRRIRLGIPARLGGGVTDEVELGEQSYNERLEEVRLFAELGEGRECAPVLEASSLVVPRGCTVGERGKEERKCRLGDMARCRSGDGCEQIEGGVTMGASLQSVRAI